MPQWTFNLSIPYVENIHPAIVAHLRTSALGEWRISANYKSDPFVLYFERGKPCIRFAFFSGKPIVSEPILTYSHVPSEDLFVKLRIVLRPSPKRIAMSLCFYLPPIEPPRDAKETGQRVTDLLHREVSALAEYFRELFDLDAPPAIETLLPAI